MDCRLSCQILTTPALTCEVGLVHCPLSVPVAMKSLDDSVPKIRFIKKRITASLGFRSVQGAYRTIEGYEAMHAIRKGQVRWVPKGDAIAQRQFIHTIFGIAE